MSNNYTWHNITGMIDCNTFKACYQICRQLTRHGFIKKYENYIGNTRFIGYEKNKTKITVYVYDKLTEPLTRRKISWYDYIKSLTNRYTRRYK